MCGTIPPLFQYAFMVWCLVKHRTNCEQNDYLKVYDTKLWANIYDPRSVGLAARMGEMSNAPKILVGKPERKHHSGNLSKGT
jgi:hypothetical protein